MAFSLSPAVEFTEKNLSFTVTNLPSSITGAVLKADSGPAFVVTDITTEEELRDTFGKPTANNYKDWYNCYNFLQYANSLKVVRPIDSAKVTKNVGIALAGGDTYMLLSLPSGSWSTLPVAGDVITQTIASTSPATTATCVVVSATDPASGNDTAVVKNVQGTFTTTAGDFVSITGTGTLTGGSIVPAIIPTKTNVQLKTYQGIEQGSLYNENIAELTIPSLSVDSYTKVLGYLDDAGSDDWVGLTKLRGKQLVAAADDLSWYITDSSGTNRTVVTFDTVPDATSIILNRTVVDSENIWDGFGNIAPTTLDLDGAPTGSSGICTGDTSGAVMTVSSVASATLTGTTVGGVFLSGESVTLSGGLSGSHTVATDTNQEVVGTLTYTADSPATGTDSISEPVSTIRLAFFARYVQNSHNIGVAVCSSATAWEQYVSTDIASTWSSFFEIKPDFASSEFAVIVFKQEDDGSFTAKERFICSYLTTGRNYLNQNIYAEDWFLNNSRYLYCVVSSSPTGTDALVNTGGDTLPMLHQSSYTSVYPRSTADYVFPATYAPSSYASGDITTAFDEMSDPDTVTVNMLMAHEDSINYASTIANSRKDCIAIVAPFDDTQLVGKTSSEGTTYLKNKFGNTDTSSPIFTDYSTYSAVYGNMKYQDDKYNGLNRWMSVIGDVCGLMAQTDNDLDPWWAAAGTQRGVMKNVIKLAFNPNKASRDTLYLNGINPVVSIAGEGIGLVMGQKTTTATASALDRINVRRLMLTIEQAIVKAMRPFMFEFNDDATRNLILGVINPYLSGIQSRRGLYDFLVVCDSTNNTAEVIDQNGLVIDIFVKPTKVAEFLQVNFLVTRTEANFSELTV